ncbi:MAG: GNAT family N-acetyltransferase [Micrococcales bacterium]|nr:GNAT family N-acetyltransferase [Micrococcales bacterium]
MPQPVGLIAQPPATTRRAAVRRRLPDGALSDIVGQVLSDDGEALVILPNDAPAVRILVRDIAARRVVPRRAVRPSSSAQALERLAAQGWPGTSASRLGGWLVRTGDGWTSAANSCLVAGDPGLPADQALGVVAAHYVRVGLTPRVQLAHAVGRPPDEKAAAVEDAAAESGWRPHGPSHVLVADLRRLPESHEQERGCAGRDGPVDVDWAGDVTPDWARIVRGGEIATDARARAVLMSAPADYLLLRDGSGAPVAAGRLVRNADWVGLSCVDVVPQRRRAGLGRAASRHLLERARHGGARFAYLQVKESNRAAFDLYRSLGFVPHHRFHYRALEAVAR